MDLAMQFTKREQQFLTSVRLDPQSRDAPFMRIPSALLIVSLLVDLFLPDDAPVWSRTERALPWLMMLVMWLEHFRVVRVAYGLIAKLVGADGGQGPVSVLGIGTHHES